MDKFLFVLKSILPILFDLFSALIEALTPDRE